MPRRLERKLRHEYPRTRYSKRRQDRIVYGTLRKIGWKPKRRRMR